MSDWRQPLSDLFRAQLYDEPAGDRLFNPYRDSDTHDAPDAPAVRRANLEAAVQAVAGAAPGGRPDVLVVAEAPGPWGCRFSGIPFTNERQLLDPDFPVDGRPSSARFAQSGEPVREMSGGIYWGAMLPHWGRFWTWNAVPFHPHRADEPLTIRTPGAREVRRWHGLLADVLGVLAPEAVLAVGRKAEGALQAVGAEPIYVRHPSQGGATLFRDGVAAFWRERGAR
ncbi:uracil-DNA glycosylase [Rubrivirga sp. IMCC45206]|uniref:uracil-DNA glycosylase n=1 Tax=Rubrivirga sp. IMCC45206 TaxID=3391614 RepID=UPI00398FC992